jgi:hypothetical protein
MAAKSFTRAFPYELCFYEPPRHQGSKEKSLTAFSSIPTDLDFLGKQIVDAAFSVHKEMGPGLLESIYEECLCLVLTQKNIPLICNHLGVLEPWW